MSQTENENIKITIKENGPALVHGNVTITLADGTEVVKEKVTAICRCGASENKPFCDGAHAKCGFTG